MTKYQLKDSLNWDWKLQVSILKIENIRTMTLDEIGLHTHNDKDCSMICSFYDNGVKGLDR